MEQQTISEDSRPAGQSTKKLGSQEQTMIHKLGSWWNEWGHSSSHVLHASKNHVLVRQPQELQMERQHPAVHPEDSCHNYSVYTPTISTLQAG